MPILDNPEQPSEKGQATSSRGLDPSTRAFWSRSAAALPVDSTGFARVETAGAETLGRRAGPPALNRPRGLLSTCANPNCASGWLHLWRRRSGPIFEGGWNCSASCTAVRIEAAVRREMDGRGVAEGSANHRHRIPLGLVMLEQGWITSEQLRKAMEAQRAAGEGRLGDWLVDRQGISEQLVTRALSLQWNCPVLTLDRHDPERMAAMLPRLFVEAFAVLPLRVAAGSILYLGFEDHLDPVLALEAERISGLRVEAGLVRGSLFRAAHERLLNARFPPADLVATQSESALVRALSRAVEQTRPVESKLVRIHDCLWLRMWKQPQNGPVPEDSTVEDVIVSLSSD